MKLHTRARQWRIREPLVLRVTKDLDFGGDRANHVLCVDDLTETDQSEVIGFGALLSMKQGLWRTNIDLVAGVSDLGYLSEGDVLAISPGGRVRVLYRQSSPHNFIFATNNCNSLCLMCSQPPALELEAERTDEHLRLIDLIDPSTSQLGITGGEPTFFKEGFLTIVEKCRDRLPHTALHVLTNGRSFSNRSFARELAAIKHPALTLGIPLYADVENVHDHVVQVRGAFAQTVHGIFNLAEEAVRIEVRNVLSRVTIRRILPWSEFLCRNMTFVSHIALMGLEMTGLVHRNFEELWIDPYDYGEKLVASTRLLDSAGFRISIYNHQLCTIPKETWRYSAKSISDWKNVYLDICSKCEVQANCGGFFQSGIKKHSAHILPIRPMATGTEI